MRTATTKPIVPAWLKGGAMLAATAMAWGGMFPVMKPLLTEMDPVTITLVRFACSIPILLVLLLCVEGRQALSFEGRGVHLWRLGTLGFAGFGILVVFGLKHTRPEHAAVMPALMPLVALAITSVRTRTWPRSRALTAVALGIAGVILVVSRGTPSVLLQGAAGQGEILVLLGVICWVLYTLEAAQFPGWSGLRFTTLTLLLGTASIAGFEALALLAGVISVPQAASLWDAVPAFAYLVLAASVMGFLFWNAGMRALGPARGVLFINLVPVTAFTVALISGHSPTFWELLGVALVIAALVLNSLSARQARKVRVLSSHDNPT